MNMMSQLGHIATSERYAQYYDIVVPFDLFKGYKAELKLGLADLLAMVYMMILQEDLNINEIERLGMDHLKDAIKNRLPH